MRLVLFIAIVYIKLKKIVYPVPNGWYMGIVAL